MHRFLWDMHYPDVPGLEKEYPIAAVPHNTAPQPASPWVMPGNYTVVLTVNGKTYSQPLTIKMDPRVKTPLSGLQQQFAMSQQIYNRMLTLAPAVDQATDLHKHLEDRLKDGQLPTDLQTELTHFNESLTSLLGSATRRPGPASQAPTLTALRAKYGALFGVLQEADEPPTTQAKAALAEVEKQLPPLWNHWLQIRNKELPALNGRLKSANQPELKLSVLPSAPRAVVSAKDKDEE